MSPVPFGGDRYIKDYKVGVDDTVYAFNGDPEHQGNGVEAELDIQYIMGPAVGIVTQAHAHSLAPSPTHPPTRPFTHSRHPILHGPQSV